MSPDPGHAGASLANPESWDAYTYTLDNPETLTDPTGLSGCQSGEVNKGCANEKDGWPSL